MPEGQQVRVGRQRDLHRRARLRHREYETARDAAVHPKWACAPVPISTALVISASGNTDRVSTAPRGAVVADTLPIVGRTPRKR